MFYHEEDRKLAIESHHLSAENQANIQVNHQYIVQELIKMRQEMAEFKMSVTYLCQIVNEKALKPVEKPVVKKTNKVKKKNG